MGLLDMFGRDALREDEEPKASKKQAEPEKHQNIPSTPSKEVKQKPLSDKAVGHVHPSSEALTTKVTLKTSKSTVVIERHDKGDVSVTESGKEIARYPKDEAKYYKTLKIGTDELKVRYKESPNIPFITAFTGEGLDVYVNDKPVQGTLHDPYETADSARLALYLLGGVVLARMLLAAMFLSDQLDGGTVVFSVLVGIGLLGLGKYSEKKPLLSMAIGGFLGLLMTADMVMGWMLQVGDSYSAGGSNPHIFTLLFWLSLLAAPTVAVFRGYFASRKIQKIEGLAAKTKEPVKHEKVGFLFIGIAATMMFIAVALGANPLDEWDGLLLWGVLIALCFIKLSRARFIGGIVTALIVFIVITAFQSVPDVGYQSQRTFKDAIENPPPSGGEYLNAQEFGIRMSHYLPLNSDLSQAQKLELCLSVAEEKLSDVTTSQQRKQGCSHYAIATREDFELGISELVQYLDEQTPQGRLEFCQSKGPELFGRDVTQEEADIACDWIANDWEEARIALLNSASEL